MHSNFKIINNNYILWNKNWLFSSFWLYLSGSQIVCDFRKVRKTLFRYRMKPVDLLLNKDVGESGFKMIRVRTEFRLFPGVVTNEYNEQSLQPLLRLESEARIYSQFRVLL